MRCAKHKPRPAIEGETENQRIIIAIGRWARIVRCESCGIFGMESHGRRKWGRAPPPIWFRRPGYTEQMATELATYRQAIGLPPA